MGRIHPAADVAHFNNHPAERAIVGPFLHGFDVSYARRVQRGNDRASVFFLKPEKSMNEFLGTDREVLLTYSPFAELQTRVLRIHDEQLADSRIDPLVSVVVCDDHGTRQKVQSWLASEPEHPTVVGLSADELARTADVHHLRDAFLQQSFRRDLFSLESPLRTDNLFFGRGAERDSLVQRLRDGQNSGLFGLRRIGKTSVLYAIQRYLDQQRMGLAGYLYLADPSKYQCRWWELLQMAVHGLAEPLALERGRRSRITALSGSYDPSRAAEAFRRDIARLLDDAPDGRILLMMDEIESITFKLSPSAHWNQDFLPFWQTLRSVHQELRGKFCYLIAGVNPYLLEQDTLEGFDNPIFATVHQIYLQPFERRELREMVRRIARFMGIKVEESVYDQLVRDYGGHPFLTRQACGVLASKVRERPGTLSLELYLSERERLGRRMDAVARQILTVLRTWYPDEYDLLRTLALGEASWFEEYVSRSPEVVSHLEGYGLIEGIAEGAKIRIELVANHLRRAKASSDLQRPPKGGASQAREEAWAQLVAGISYRRNKIERGLRKILHNGLVMKYGRRAAAKTMESIESSRRERLMNCSLADVWEQLYFAELVVILERNWEVFQVLFGEDRQRVVTWLDHINRCRVDAHAKSIGEDDLTFLNVCFGRLDEIMGLWV